MPWIFQAIAAVLPATYFVNMVRAIVLRGAGFADFAPDALILTTIGLTFFILAAARFKKRLG
jgi:ABC-2 type transport system permease protein